MPTMLRATLAGLILVLTACGSHAATSTATPATLQSLLDNARSGDRITLAPGDYDVEIRVRNKKWSPAVVVDGTAGTLRQVELNGISGLEWHGGSFNGSSTAHTGFSAGTSDHIVVDKLKMTGYTRNGIIFGESSDSRIADNVFSDMGSDGIDIAMSRRIVIDGNSCVANDPTPGAHPDCIQLWSRPSSLPVADITITNNTANGNMQGITGFNHVRNGVDDGGFDRIRIENNKLAVMMWHGIALGECRECIVRNNRVDALPNGRVRAWIKFDKLSTVKACGNIASAWSKSEDAKCKD